MFVWILENSINQQTLSYVTLKRGGSEHFVQKLAVYISMHN